MSTIPEIQLSTREIVVAAEVGVLRRAEDILKKRKPHGTIVGNVGIWHAEIEGALGEAAVAKHFGIWWMGALGNLRAFDVGNFQVRTTHHPDGCLLLQKKDSDDQIFILVVGKDGKYRLPGWIMARDGKQERWWKDPVGNHPCYFVPQADLLPMDRLPRWKT